MTSLFRVRFRSYKVKQQAWSLNTSRRVSDCRLCYRGDISRSLSDAWRHAEHAHTTSNSIAWPLDLRLTLCDLCNGLQQWLCPVTAKSDKHAWIDPAMWSKSIPIIRFCKTTTMNTLNTKFILSLFFEGSDITRLYIYTSFIHRTTAVEKINEQEIQLNKRTNNTKAHERIKR